MQLMVWYQPKTAVWTARVNQSDRKAVITPWTRTENQLLILNQSLAVVPMEQRIEERQWEMKQLSQQKKWQMMVVERPQLNVKVRVEEIWRRKEEEERGGRMEKGWSWRREERTGELPG
jgi:hypothetical protein